MGSFTTFDYEESLYRLSECIDLPKDTIEEKIERDHPDLTFRNFYDLVDGQTFQWEVLFGENQPDSYDEIYNPSCRECDLFSSVNKVCVGADLNDPDNVEYLWVGEAPGKHEDEIGQPFVGESGNRLRHVIRQEYDVDKVQIDGSVQTFTVDGSSVYEQSAFTNLVKCRPPGNRDPSNDEKSSCEDYLFREIEYFDPDVVVTLGKQATMTVLGKIGSQGLVGRRGAFFTDPVTDRMIYPMCHPAKPGYDLWWRDFFLQDVRNVVGHEVEVDEPEVTVVQDQDDLHEMDQELSRSDELAFDLETVSQSPFMPDDDSGRDPRILCASFASKWSKGFVLNKSHRGFEGDDVWGDGINIVRPLLESSDVRSIAHNAKFDLRFLREFESIQTNNVVDTEILSSTVDERKGCSKLSNSSQRHLGWGHKGVIDLLYERLPKKKRDYGYLPWDYLGPYAGHDASVLIPLRRTLWETMRDRDQTDVWDEVMSDVVPVFVEAECYGTLVDDGRLEEMQEEVPKVEQQLITELRSIDEVQEFEFFRAKERAGYQKDIIEHRPEHTIEEGDEYVLPSRRHEEIVEVEDGEVVFSDGSEHTIDEVREMKRIEYEPEPIDPEPFNPRSPKQVRRVLFDQKYLDSGDQGFDDNLKASMVAKTSTGNPSAGSDELETIKAKAESGMVQKPNQLEFFCDRMLTYKNVSKLLSSFIEPLPDFLDNNCRVHPNYILTGARTGRISCSDPNLQQIPKNSDVVNFRELFTVPEDHYWGSMDFSQAELRVIANQSGDETMRQIYQQGEDLHNATKESVLNMDGVPDRIKDQFKRGDAKTINFGICYGQSPSSLSDEMGVSEGVAGNFIDAFYRQYPDVKSWENEIEEKATEQGYVTTPFGRRRHLPRIHSDDEYWYAKAVRRAVNFPIQSTASDITLLSMVKMANAIEEKNMDTTILLNVHDEINFEVPKDEVEEFYKTCKNQCENWPELDWLDVPIEVDVEIGPNWGNVVEV